LRHHVRLRRIGLSLKLAFYSVGRNELRRAATKLRARQRAISIKSASQGRVASSPNSQVGQAGMRGYIAQLAKPVQPITWICLEEVLVALWA